MTALSDVLLELMDERERQEAKFPDQHLPNGTDKVWSVIRDGARLRTDRRAELGTVTWLDVLTEEFYEAMAEEDPARLRAELIQVAAVAVRWIEDLDRVEVES